MYHVLIVRYSKYYLALAIYRTI